ncbi:disaggregatase related repeat-containing protein, partial [Methanomethylovorans sp.]|uniref:disaggregatase related repeat-containing protein n=1 Tax=Methanomethylovorans sp. TaxID=2758717 RepID=UPI00351C3F9D
MICFASIGSATDYYVSNDGSDLSSGLSINDAWATPSHAVSKTGTASTVGAGDTIYLLDGIWRDEVVDFKVSGNPGNPITMTAYDGATPVIYTDNGHSAWGDNENGYFGIEIRGQEYINISGITMGGYRADVWIGNSDNIHISDMHLGKYGSYDSQFAMMMYYDVHNSSLTNSVCSGSYHDTVCVWGHTYNNNPSIPHITTNILIDGNVIKDSSTHNMVDLNDAVRNIMISNNTISDDAETGVWMHTYDEIYENITIKDNNFVDCYRAIRPINTTNLRIIGNTFTNTGSGGDIRMYGEYSGAQAGVNRNVYVADNVFDEIPHFETVVTGLFENNTIKSDEYYRFENCRDIVVRNENGNNFEIRANSNTDGVFEYTDGRVFKATRTSGTNYASPNTVISSPEGSKLYMKSEGTNLYYDFIIDHNSVNDDINHAPVLNTVGSRTVDAGNTLRFTASASDIDGDVLVYSASGLPEGAIFDSTSESFSWTPSSGQAGIYTVVFKVTDGKLTDSETISITVNAENTTPTDENTTPTDENITPAQSIIYDNRLRGPSPDATLAEDIYIDIGYYENRGLYRDVMWFDLSDYNETDTITNATLSLYWYFP